MKMIMVLIGSIGIFASSFAQNEKETANRTEVQTKITASRDQKSNAQQIHSNGLNKDSGVTSTMVVEQPIPIATNPETIKENRLLTPAPITNQVPQINNGTGTTVLNTSTGAAPSQRPK